MNDDASPGDARSAPYAGTNVSAALGALHAALRGADVSEPRADARHLLAHALGIEPARIPFEPDRKLTTDEAMRLAAFERERVAGRTVGRIIGRRAFHDIALAVSDDVLEPRDDTGALVELALPYVRATCERRGTADVLDCGVGAGTVALAILAAEPRARALGTDTNRAALALARRNARALDLQRRFVATRHSLLTGGWPDGVPFDVVVSNPPYLTTDEVTSLAGEARHDPRAALDGGEDGLLFYRALARLTEPGLAPGAILAVEIGAGQGADVRTIMRAQGWHEVGAKHDLGGHERALAFSRVVKGTETGGG